MAETPGGPFKQNNSATQASAGPNGSVAQNGNGKGARTGLEIRRIYTRDGVHPYDEVTWERRDVVMTNWRDGTVNFEQRGVEFPDFWSVNAANIVTTKYFRGAVGDTEARVEPEAAHRPGRRRLRARPGASTATSPAEEDAEIFDHELTYVLMHQIFSFNSPVWFNVGTILAAAGLRVLHPGRGRHDGLDPELVPGGGPDLQGRLRRGRQPVPDPLQPRSCSSSGGTASGPVSFMRGADASAGTIKSGGATRRAAKMVVLDVDHPDIEEFIETKAREEEKVRALRDAGFDMDLGGKDIVTVQYQNANNSVRVSDEFMRAVEDDGEFDLLGPADRRGHRDGRGQGACCARSPRPRGSAPTPASSTTTRSTTGTPARSPAGSPPATRARSTSTWTTPRATWPASTC